jgi:cytochrome c oxidase subunit IV
MAKHEEHVVSPRIYIVVLIALMGLLGLTIAAAFFDLDRITGRSHEGTTYWSMSVAVLIAISKALLIVLFFMHVKYGTKLVWAFAAAGFFWLGIMMTLTLSDYFTRNYPKDSPKSSPMEANPQIMRPPPRHDSVVGDAGNALPVPGGNPAFAHALRAPSDLTGRPFPWPIPDGAPAPHRSPA